MTYQKNWFLASETKILLNQCHLVEGRKIRRTTQGLRAKLEWAYGETGF